MTDADIEASAYARAPVYQDEGSDSSQENIVTQARQTTPLHAHESIPEVFVLDVRGTRFSIERSKLLNLPESILFYLSGGLSVPDADSQITDTENVAQVEFNPHCLEYALSFFGEIDAKLEPRVIPLSRFSEFGGPQDPRGPDALPQIYLERPAVIVLKEDVECYCLVDTNSSQETLSEIRRECGAQVLGCGRVFEFMLSYAESDSPEYHLMDMLCRAGLDPDLKWASRELEPNRTIVTSLQLSPVKLPESDADANTIQALQKVLLFWKKPARKCWWHKLKLDTSKGPVHVHLRQVWTLELAILGVE